MFQNLRRIFFEASTLSQKTLELISKIPNARIRKLEGEVSTVEYSPTKYVDNLSAHFGITYPMGYVRETKPLLGHNTHYFVYLPSGRLNSFPYGLALTDRDFIDKQKQLGLNDYNTIKILRTPNGFRSDYLRRIFETFHATIRDAVAFVIYDRKGRLIIDPLLRPQSGTEEVVLPKQKLIGSSTPNYSNPWTKKYHSIPRTKNH